MRQNPVVNVLLSTYGSSPYLESFLRSLRQQEAVSVELTYHVDDGCLDDSELILRFFPNAQSINAPTGLGVPAAYVHLLNQSNRKADVWAFADQDDVWMPTKLRRSYEALTMASKSSQPALWFCHFSLIDGGDRPIKTPKHREEKVVDFGNALVETVAPGCCLVWNEPLQDLLRQTNSSLGMVMHDSWTYLVASAFGGVVEEKEPLIQYRIHAGNTIGLPRSRLRNWTRRLARLNDLARPTHATQASLLLETFPEYLTAGQYELTEALAKGKTFRLLRLIFEGHLHRSQFADQLGLVAALCIRSMTYKTLRVLSLDRFLHRKSKRS